MLHWLPVTDLYPLFLRIEGPAPLAPGAGGAGQAQRAPSSPDNAKRDRDRNRNRDMRLCGSTPLAAKIKQASIRAILENNPVPRRADSTEICLQYHLKGDCLVQCKRSHQPLEGDDKEAFFNWCKTTFK